MPKQLMKYRVVREHIGHAEGTVREAYPEDVGHLVPHVLDPIGPASFGGKGDHDGDSATGGAAAEKAEQPSLNKAEGAAPANKAARSRKSKGK
jgi:hypothetical protein